MRLAIMARSISSTASATSASTVRPLADTSAKPPSTTIFCSPLPACTVRMPGRTVATVGACFASTPKSPSAPGISTCSTSPENNSFSGETSSKCKLATVCSTSSLAACESDGKTDSTANRCHDCNVLDLLAGERSTARPLVVAHFEAQRPYPDLSRFFGARHVAGKTADHQSDQQKRKQVGSPQHGP